MPGGCSRRTSSRTTGSQRKSGHAILMTVANSNGRAFWVTVEDVTFRHNVVRHAGGGLNILGRDQHGDPSGVARGIRSQATCSTTSTRNGGGAGNFVQILHGPE